MVLIKKVANSGGFFENISIRERESYEMQRQHLPLHFREHMTEFEE